MDLFIEAFLVALTPLPARFSIIINVLDFLLWHQCLIEQEGLGQPRSGGMKTEKRRIRLIHQVSSPGRGFFFLRPVS